MPTRADYANRLASQLGQWDATIAEWSARADRVALSERIQCENELDSLRSKRAVAQHTLQELGRHGDGRWDELRASADRVEREMNRAVKRGAVRFV